jgi:hypothetical protein
LIERISSDLDIETVENVKYKYIGEIPLVVKNPFMSEATDVT